MASKSDIKAGGAFIELFLKDGKFTKGLLGAKKRLQSFGSDMMRFGGAVAGLGTALLAPLAGAVTHFITAGSALDDMSNRTGIARSTLGELKFAAEQSGASLEDVEKGTRKMAKVVVDADRGLKSAQDSLKLLGLTAKDLKGKLPEEQFQIIADRLAAIEDPTIRTAAAVEILGKSGTQLLPMVGQLRQLREEARRLGLAPTEDSVKMADALGDAFDSVTSVIGASIFEVGAALAPLLLPAANAFREIAGFVNLWVRDNGQLIRTIALIGAGLVAAGAVITALGVAVFGVGAAFGVLATIVSTVAGAVALLTSPVVLIVAGIAAGIAAWVMFTDSGKAAFDTFKDIIGDIGTRLLKGDLQGAWETVVMGMATIWDSFVAGIVTAMHEAVNIILGLWQQVTAVASSALTAIEIALRAKGQDTLANLVGGAKGGLNVAASAGTALGVGAKTAMGVAASIAQAKAAKSAEDFADRVGGGSERLTDEIGAIVDEIKGLFGDLAAAGAEGGATPELDLSPEGMAKAIAATVTFSGSALLAAGQGAGASDPLVREAKEHKKLTAETNKKLDKLIEKSGGWTFGM